MKSVNPPLRSVESEGVCPCVSDVVLSAVFCGEMFAMKINAQNGVLLFCFEMVIHFLRKV